MTELRRAISSRMLIVLIVGDILGAGIYTLVGRLSNYVGGMIWLPLAIGFVASALTAASYAELVGKYPKAAGAALYAHRAFGRPFLTFMVAFAVMMSGIASASAAAVAFGGDYLQAFVAVPWWLAAAVFIALIALINFVGIGESVKVNLVLTIIEASGLAIVIGFGILGIAQGAGAPERAFELAPETPRGSLLGIIGATALGFYALLGFEDSVNLAEECEEPHRAFPRALFVGISITGTIYLIVAFVAAALVEPSVLAASNAPLLDVVNATGVELSPRMFSAIALFAICNTALLNMIMASRLLYGMAKVGVVPRGFGRVHRARKTPYVAIAFTVAIAGALIAIGRDVATLASTCTFLLLLVFATVNVAVLVLRQRPVQHPHFRAPTWAPVLGLAITLVLASPLAGREWIIYALAAALLGLGIALWLLQSWRRGDSVSTLDAKQVV